MFFLTEIEGWTDKSEDSRRLSQWLLGRTSQCLQDQQTEAVLRVCTWQQGSVVCMPPLVITISGSRSGGASGAGGLSAVSAAAMPDRSCCRISATAASSEPPACGQWWQASHNSAWRILS